MALRRLGAPAHPSDMAVALSRIQRRISQHQRAGKWCAFQTRMANVPKRPCRRVIPCNCSGCGLGRKNPPEWRFLPAFTRAETQAPNPRVGQGSEMPWFRTPALLPATDHNPLKAVGRHKPGGWSTLTATQAEKSAKPLSVSRSQSRFARHDFWGPPTNSTATDSKPVNAVQKSRWICFMMKKKTNRGVGKRGPGPRDRR